MTQQARLLFVDDEQGIVNILRAMFRHDYEVHIATDPREALNLVRQMHFHVVVSDQRMPDMTGVELLSKVRDVSPNSMRILLTGYSDLAAMVGSINSGEVYRFISKPWDQNELKATILEAAKIAIQTANAPVAAPVSDEQLAESEVTPTTELLVIDDDPAVAPAIEKLFGGAIAVHASKSVVDALDVLKTRDVGVIIADLHADKNDVVQLLRILKHQYPLILTIMLAQISDSELVMKLINQVQVFRYTSKPIKKGALQLAVKAALRQHAVYKANPQLMKRHKVEQPVDAQSDSLGAWIIGSLRSLRGRF
ncbi:MAG: response regulator [Rhodocyclaceae bacterium]